MVKHWKDLDLQRPTWIDNDAVWEHTLGVTGLEPYTFAEFDALPQTGDRITAHGMLFEFEVVDFTDMTGRFVRHDFTFNGKKVPGLFHRGTHLRHYRMHRVPRWRDVATAPMSRLVRRVQAALEPEAPLPKAVTL